MEVKFKKERSDMRIESMDASIKFIERTADTPVQNNISPRTTNHRPEDDGFIIEKNTGMQVSEKFLINAIEKANRAMITANRALEFSVHEKTKEIMVKVVDTATKEVIREIPSEKILDMVASILEMAGILVDERR
jgi:flagellar protein FlaG